MGGSGVGEGGTDVCICTLCACHHTSLHLTSASFKKMRKKTKKINKQIIMRPNNNVSLTRGRDAAAECLTSGGEAVLYGHLSSRQGPGQG